MLVENEAERADKMPGAPDIANIFIHRRNGNHVRMTAEDVEAGTTPPDTDLTRKSMKAVSME